MAFLAPLGRATALAASALLLAGCAGPGPDGPDGASSTDGPAPGLPQAVAFGSCRATGWQVAVPEEALRARLPAGYEPDLSLDPLGLGVPGSFLGLLAMECASGEVGGRMTADMPFASVFARIRPPAGAAGSGGSAEHFYQWEALVADPELRALLAGSGAAASSGNVTLSYAVRPPGTPPLVDTADVDLDGLGPFSCRGLLPTNTPAPPASGAVRFYTAAGEGAVVWDGVLERTSPMAVGTCPATFPPGSWPAEVAGADVAPATMVGMSVRLGATVSLVGAAP